jgi:hypothetical protein
MAIRYHVEPETGLPHIYGHGITEEEVEQVLAGAGDDYPAKRDSRMKLGQTAAGRYLQVVYVPDEDGPDVFVITAYDLKGKSKKSFRRRKRRKDR